jgi:hypothetical protein
MAIGLGVMQLLPVGRQRVLGSVLQEKSVARRSRGVSGEIVNGAPFQRSGRLSLVATSSVAGRSFGSRSWRSGVVSCSESNVFDTALEPANDVVELTTSSSSPSTVLTSFTEAGIEVVRSIEEAENEVLRAVSAVGEGESIGKEVGETPIMSTVDALSLEGDMLNGQTRLLTLLEQPSAAVAASVMISEVANVLKTLERDGTESSESDISNSEEAELEVDEHDKLVNGLQQLVEPSLMASEMVESLLPASTPTSDEASSQEENVLEHGPISVVESKNFFEQLRDIVVFAGPALGIWLSGPIMSLIDTAVVGNSSSLELAALGKFSSWRVRLCGYFFCNE